MEPTIKVGDRLLANKLAYNFKIPFTNNVIASWGQPKRGDIIVFRSPRDTSIDYVKRVIAVAGDQVRFENDVVYVNDQPLKRVDYNFDRSILDDIQDRKDIKLLSREFLDDKDYFIMQNATVHKTLDKNWPSDGRNFTVPEGTVFVCGDNRDNSNDSRSWGAVPLSYVRGKATFVIWSMYMPEDANFPRFRFHRFGHVLQ
jgi:signal peptidase I